ncbi:MAG: hypothetical protein FD147_693 [Chloroflexi bacterium]|nr:MAG: hypothetical protein FD147_693 [Chloroflexota bacterium]MBA4376226.1 hypothetical protein [Anaerolinea sp.]
MKHYTKIIVVFLLIAFVVASCNLPGTTTADPVTQQTPNATLTALFDTSKNIPATITPPVIETAAPVLPTVELPTAMVVLTATPTATIAVPATEQPTAVPMVRSNAQMVAKFLATPPIQDGTYAEWVEKTTKYTLPYRVWGASNWTGQKDLEGAFAAGWDSTYLYIGVKVTDELYTQKKTGDQIYMGDDVEILIDTNLLGDFYNTSLDKDDYQLGLSAGNPSMELAKEAYLWYPSNVKGPRPQVIMSTVFETGPIYRIEAAIPWSMLGVTPTNGMRLGFAVSVNDNDNVTTYKEQTMISTAAGLSVFNPTTWGELVLVK